MSTTTTPKMRVTRQPLSPKARASPISRVVRDHAPRSPATSGMGSFKSLFTSAKASKTAVPLPVAAPGDENAKPANVDASAATPRAMTMRLAELDVRERAALESHPVYLEHIGNSDQYSEIINAQLDGSKKDTGKLVAQQRGLILNLKSVAQNLISQRDELVERVCLQDIAAQRRDSQMQAEIKRLKMDVAEADARQTQFEIASAERDRSVKELASVKALHAGQREADAKDAELQVAQLKLKIAQLEGEVQREHANFLAETNKIISLEVSLDEQVKAQKQSEAQIEALRGAAQSDVAGLVENHEKEVSGLKCEIQAKNEEIILLSQAKDEEITAIKKEIEEAKDEEVASLKIQLQAKDEEIVMLKEAVAKAVGKASSTCEEVASLKRELADLETFASKRQQAAHNLASEMESLIASHEEKVAILNREMEAKDGEVMSLKRDLEVASGNSEDAESLKKAYSSELSAVVCKHAEEVSSLKGLIVAAEARLAEEVSSLSSRMEAAAAEHAEEMAIREEALTLGTERWSTAEEVMRAKVDALEGEVREERLRVEEREEELGEARELMRQMDERHAEELESFKERIKEERRQAMQERERADRGECVLKVKDAECFELMETLKERDEECMGLKEAASRRGEELEKESNSKQNAIGSMMQKMSELREELSQAERALKRSNADAAEARAMHGEVKAALAKAETDLKAEISAHAESRDALIHAEADSKVSQQAMKEEVASLEAAEARARGERDAAEEKCKDLKANLVACEGRLINLEKKLDDKDVQVQEALRTVEKVQDAQSARSRELLEERDKLLEELSALRHDLRREADERREREAASRAEIDEARDRHATKQAELKAEADSIREELKDALRERDAMEERLREREETTRTEADSLKEEVQRIKSEHLEAGLRRQEQETRLEIERVAHEALREELAVFKDRAETLSKAKADVSEQLAVIEAEYRTYKSMCDANSPVDLREHLTSILSLEAEKARAGSKAETAAEQAEEYQELVTRLRSQVADLQHRLATVELVRRKLHNELTELRGNIRVYARVRPNKEGSATAIDLSDQGSISLPYNGVVSSFKMDRVFGPLSSQGDVFGDVSNLVQSALDGYSVALFAYGQTGSGKTHTMFGGDGDEAGIIPRSIAQILHSVQQHRDSGWTYELKASFLEIYNESVRDLLCSPEQCGSRQYKISMGENGRAEVSDLEWEAVQDVEDLERIIDTAGKNKTTAKTDMNERSSRSHTIFSLRITGCREGTGPGGGGQMTTLHGSLHLVDLAGSERLSKSNATGQQLKETQAINKSLSALSDVFVAISKKQAHVPYRNSKLTYLLQPCLSGDGKALVITNLSPTESSAHESLCSLRFASMVGSCELGKAAKHVKMEADGARPRTAPAAQLPTKTMDMVLDGLDSSTINDLSAIEMDLSEAPSILSHAGRTRTRAPTTTAATTGTGGTAGTPSRSGRAATTPSKTPAKSTISSSPRVGGTPSRVGTPSRLAAPSRAGTPLSSRVPAASAEVSARKMLR